MNDNDKRVEYTAGLRTLADLLDQHDELPLPYHGANSEISFHYLAGDARAALARFAQIMPGSFDKETYSDYFQITGAVRGLRVAATAYRDAVCTRVVTGTREVTEEVRDPAALAAVPTTTVTSVVEDIEWVCEPLLADRSAGAA